MPQNKQIVPNVSRKIDTLLDQYRKKQDKAQLTTTYTRSSQKTKTGSNKNKFETIRFKKREGHLKYNMYSKLYPQSLVFGDSAKLLTEIPEKKIKVRDNDDVSEEGDIKHAVEKGMRRLNEEIAIMKMTKAIQKKEEKLQKKKLIAKAQK